VTIGESSPVVAATIASFELAFRLDDTGARIIGTARATPGVADAFHLGDSSRVLRDQLGIPSDGAWIVPIVLLDQCARASKLLEPRGIDSR
jgi:hypothetical protein